MPKFKYIMQKRVDHSRVLLRTGDFEYRANSQEEPSQNRAQLWLEIEAHDFAQRGITTRRVNGKSVVRHFKDSRQQEQEYGRPWVPVRVAGEFKEVLESLLRHLHKLRLDFCPVVPVYLVRVHFEQDPQSAGHRLRLLFQQVGLDVATESRLPQQISLLVVGVELFGETMRLHQTLDEPQQVFGGERTVHSLLLFLLLILAAPRIHLGLAVEHVRLCLRQILLVLLARGRRVKHDIVDGLYQFQLHHTLDQQARENFHSCTFAVVYALSAAASFQYTNVPV